jgi:hypothetical protein
MNIQHTLIRTIASSSALVVLRLVFELFFPERQRASIEALAATGSVIHARKFAGTIRAAARQARRRDAFGTASQAFGQPLCQALTLLNRARKAPMRDDFSPT